MNLDSGRLVALNVVASKSEMLADPSHVERFFFDLIAKIEMKPLTLPMSVVVEPDESAVDQIHGDDGGLTTQCIIQTSHIAYHSWPLQSRFRLVVDSCKDYLVERVIDTVCEWFAVKSYSVQDVRYEPPNIRVVDAQATYTKEAFAETGT